MLNNLVLVGRIANIEERGTYNEITTTIVTVAVPRSYKNIEGVYETDFIPCVLYNGIAKNTMENCKKGDTIGIKGKVQMKENELNIIADKVTFLSSKAKED